MTGRPKSAVRCELEVLLADGEWHEREALIRKAAAAVPAGVALRAVQAKLARKRMRDGVVNPVGPRTSCENQIEVGRRSKARGALYQMVRRGTAQLVDGMVRITPEQSHDRP